ncbi:MAG: iron chelate uptake ABC transporter family permease subunit [Ilumatobacteraceae bacterium]
MSSPTLTSRESAAVVADTAGDATVIGAPAPARAQTARRIVGIVVLVVLLVFAAIASLAVGAKAIPVSDVIQAFTGYDPLDTNHLIVRELRLPRTMVGIMVGAALGVAGAVMQAVTRNPLADPGLLGVNAGASFAVVLAIWWFGISSMMGLVWFAFLGAALASVAVYLLGSMGRGGATPVRMALAGAALSALLFALTRAVTIIDQVTLDQFRFWAVGSLSGRDADVVRNLVGFVIVGLVLAIGISRQLNALGLGEDTAAALGVKVGLTRAVSGVSIMLLCGAAVAAVGPIAFVGLVIPHAMRAWFGPDQRWLLPSCALAGPILLLVCDTLGRVVARPGEVQVGIMTAAIGGPAFVYLVRRVRIVQL